MVSFWLVSSTRPDLANETFDEPEVAAGDRVTLFAASVGEGGIDG